MAELEAEVFTLGKWKNFSELEESVSMVELDLILKVKRNKEKMDREFNAAINGVDLKKNENDIEERLERVQRNAALRLAGGEAELEKQELSELGFGFESV